MATSSTYKIGIDIGNYDTKTQHTTTPSGYKEYSIQPQLTNEYLKYGNKYYAPTVNRFEYVKDKRENDQAFILSLFGIAKEILYGVKAHYGMDLPQDKVQSVISSIFHVSVGAGLPVGDFTKLKDDTTKYFKDKFKGSVNFEYSGYKFSFVVDDVQLFPQDILPVSANPNCVTSNKYKKYVIIGIGGQTVDVIPVINNIPIAEKCISLREGVRKMFADIIGAVETNFGTTIGEDSVEEVLLGNETTLPSDIEVTIRAEAKKHTEHILNACVQRGINFIEYPAVFFGGGGLLLRPYIENNKTVTSKEFLMDVRGNAVCYASRLK